MSDDTDMQQQLAAAVDGVRKAIGVDCWHDIGPNLTCTEATALAELLVLFVGPDDGAALMSGHIEHDGESDEDAAAHGALDVNSRWFDPGSRHWQALSFDERVARLQMAQDVDVLSDGYGIQAVFPTDDSADEGMDYHFAYTYGRCLQNRPELVVVGLSHSAGGMISVVAAHVDEHGFELGVPFTIGEGGLVVLAPVPAEWTLRNMGAARRYVEHVDAVQILWADDDGRWPWDPDRVAENVAENRTPIKPLIGDDWRPVSVS